MRLSVPAECSAATHLPPRRSLPTESACTRTRLYCKGVNTRFYCYASAADGCLGRDAGSVGRGGQLAGSLPPGFLSAGHQGSRGASLGLICSAGSPL
eukprot:XP_001706517.1 Hypothetical protein GL50803_32245 [Giardia lamblia ATCC 50803]